MDRRALALSLRSLLRMLVRGLPARLFVLPALERNERSVAALEAYVARRAGVLGVPLPPDATGLHAVPAGAALLTKSALRQQGARHVRPRRFGSLLRTTIRTSGTTGSPLSLEQSLGAVVREEAFVQRQLGWIGWRPGQRRAWIRGDIVCDARPADGRYWRRDWIGRMLFMSSYHLSGETIGAYVAALEDFDPVVIHAYPSSAGAIAHWLAAAGRRYGGRSLRGVMTSSETLAPGVRAAIAGAFGVPVFDWYGQAERVAAIGTCEQGRYHLLTDYGGVELLALPGGTSELVGTSLGNAAMPLARYRTGDTIVVGDLAPCPCGRVFPTIDAVIGRQERIVTLPDGRMVARLDRVFQGQDRCLIEGQVRYHGQGRFTLRVVATDAFDSQAEAALRERFLSRVPGVQVAVERVGAIERGANGKFEFIALEE